MNWRDRVAALLSPGLVMDAHIYGGLLLAAIGGWRLSPAWTLVAVGVTLVALGLLAPRGKDGGS